MASRMEQRNVNAESEGGDKLDRRDHLRYYEKQYGPLFGKENEAGSLLSPPQEISREDIYNIAEKFGDAEVDGKNFKIRDLKKEAISGSFTAEENNEADNIVDLAVRKEGKKILDAIGFEEGEDCVAISSKVAAHVIFDHKELKTPEISSQIIGFISQSMVATQEVLGTNSVDKDSDIQPKAKEAEDIIPSGKSWVERISDSQRAKDDSKIVR